MNILHTSFKLTKDNCTKFLHAVAITKCTIFHFYTLYDESFHETMVKSMSAFTILKFSSSEKLEKFKSLTQFKINFPENIKTNV